MFSPEEQHRQEEEKEEQLPVHMSQQLREYYSQTVCLCRAELGHVPPSVFTDSSIWHLCLEENQISSVPGSLFTSLPNLLWLDLRYNHITSLPAEIGLHRCLKTLLLEGNPITELPLQLGNVLTLRGLNLRDCPLTFPPQDVVQQGVYAILRFLRRRLAEQEVGVKKTPSEVEKLQLSELMRSGTEEQDEPAEQEELQKFEELKTKMILLDRAELASAAPSSQSQSPPIPPIISRRKAAPKAGIIPDFQQSRREEERRQAAVKELKEQRRQNQEALRKWHTRAKIPQYKKTTQQRKGEEAQTVSEAAPNDSDSPHSRIPGKEEEPRSLHRLERQTLECLERIHQRRLNPRGSSSEQMAAADHDVEETRRLMARLLEKTGNRSVLRGDTWQSLLDD